MIQLGHPVKATQTGAYLEPNEREGFCPRLKSLAKPFSGTCQPEGYLFNRKYLQVDEDWLSEQVGVR